MRIRRAHQAVGMAGRTSVEQYLGRVLPIHHGIRSLDYQSKMHGGGEHDRWQPKACVGGADIK